jgi:hypothetical protein
MKRVLLVLSVALISTVAFAQEPDIHLKPGKGLDTLEANCNACHSLDYIQMNSPAPNKDFWAAEVKKMRGPYGAPVGDDDANTIVEYLNAQYGG